MKFKYHILNFLRKEIIRQLIGFFIVGVFSNFISFSFYLIIFNFINSSIIISSILGQIFGFISNYFFNSRMVFAKKVNLNKKIFYFGYYFFMIMIFGFSTEFLTIHYFDYRLSWLLCVIFISMLNFIFLKFFTFRN